LTLLRETRIHPQFAGYLCLLWESARRNTPDNLRPSFKDFFRLFLAVPGGDEDKPYLMPFGDSASITNAHLWFNKNIAGSYAPSSLRPGSPFLRVASSASDGRVPVYRLKPEHAEIALQYMLYGKKLSAAVLACFLYRNSGFENPMTHALLIDSLRIDFGMPSRAPAGDAVFRTLFNSEIPRSFSDEDFVHRR
jgi:hypothetical protein